MTLFTPSLELFAVGNQDKATALNVLQVLKLRGWKPRSSLSVKAATMDELRSNGRCPTVTAIYVSITVEPRPADEGVSASMFVCSADDAASQVFLVTM